MVLLWRSQAGRPIPQISTHGSVAFATVWRSIGAAGAATVAAPVWTFPATTRPFVFPATQRGRP